MAKPNFILPNKPAIKAGSILSYNYTDDLKFAAEPLDFSRNSSATRVNEQGLIEEVGYFGPQLVQNGDFSQEGSELITNGDFATDSDWNLRSSWVISNGNCSLTPPNSDYLSQSNVLTSNKSYKLTFDIIVNSGNLQPQFFDGGFQTIGTYNTTQTVEVYFKPTSSGTLYFKPNLFDGSIDNVSVKEVGQNWSFGSGWSMGDGVVSLNSPTGNLDQSLTATSGSKYRVTFTISNYVSGDIRWRFTGTSNENGTLRSANGTYTEEITLTNSQSIFRFPATGGVMDIDNVSVVEVLGDKPRIDYSDSSTEPSLLLEPQSTNLITYSEDFANAAWSKIGNTVVTSNTVISPNGTLNGSTVSGLSGTGTNDLRFVKSENTANNTYTYSVYLKGSGTVRIQLSNGIDQGFDDTITLTSSWKRHFLTCTFNSTTTPSLTANLDDLNGQTATQYDVWGAQLEQLSYATSYIPTSGSTATRLGETANNAGGAGVFNSEEGVLYLEVSRFANDILNTAISINQNGDFTNSVSIKFRSTENLIFGIIYSSGNISTLMQYTLPDDTQFNKIAISYAENNFSLWVNGIKVLTDTSGNAPIGLNNLSFNLGTELFYGKTKNLQVFNHALTDEELQTLTT